MQVSLLSLINIKLLLSHSANTHHLATRISKLQQVHAISYFIQWYTDIIILARIYVKLGNSTTNHIDNIDTSNSFVID